MSPSNFDRLVTLLRNQNPLTPYVDLRDFANALLTEGWLPPAGFEVEGERDLNLLPIGSVVRIDGKLYHKVTNTFFCWTEQDPYRFPTEDIAERGTPVLIYRGETK